MQVAHGPRFVVEAKDHSSPLTLRGDRGILVALQASMINRNAQFAIAVVQAERAFPKEVGAFNDCEQDKILCRLGDVGELLEAAYRWLVPLCSPVWPSTKVSMSPPWSPASRKPGGHFASLLLRGQGRGYLEGSRWDLIDGPVPASPGKSGTGPRSRRLVAHPREGVLIVVFMMFRHR